jgi:hypothetical protein
MQKSVWRLILYVCASNRTSCVACAKVVRVFVAISCDISRFGVQRGQGSSSGCLHGNQQITLNYTGCSKCGNMYGVLSIIRSSKLQPSGWCRPLLHKLQPAPPGNRTSAAAIFAHVDRASAPERRILSNEPQLFLSASVPTRCPDSDKFGPIGLQWFLTRGNALLLRSCLLLAPFEGRVPEQPRSALERAELNPQVGSSLSPFG